MKTVWICGLVAGACWSVSAWAVKPGDSLTLRYRFYFHKGDPEAAKVADAYAAYVSSLK